MSRQRASASPWNGGSISRRWRMCSAPSSTRIERAPVNGSIAADAAPGRSTSGPAANTRLTSSGFQISTSGASLVAIRSVNGSP